MTISIDPRYPDEKWRVAFDWSASINNENTILSVTAVPIGGDAEITEISTVDKTTSFFIAGGSPAQFSRIAMTAILSSGEKIGFNILAPIRAR
mgnify:CR=1 FL=1